MNNVVPCASLRAQVQRIVDGLSQRVPEWETALRNASDYIDIHMQGNTVNLSDLRNAVGDRDAALSWAKPLDSGLALALWLIAPLLQAATYAMRLEDAWMESFSEQLREEQALAARMAADAGALK